MLNLLTQQQFKRYLPSIGKQPIKSIVENLFSGRYEDNRLFLVIRYIIQSGYRFSTGEEFQALRRPHLCFEEALAFLFARCGYSFSPSDIAAIGKLETDWKLTLEGEVKRYADWHNSIINETDPSNYSAFMIYNSGNPQFAHFLSYGHYIGFDFGGDLTRTELPQHSYVLHLNHGDSGWVIQADYPTENSFDPLYQQIIMQDLLSCLNDALCKKQDFDLSEHIKAMRIGFLEQFSGVFIPFAGF